MHIETLYKVLQGDHEQEVRVATALKAAGVAAAVKSLPYMKETIFPALSKMAKNTEGGQRIELAGVLMDMAKPLGKDAAIELVFPDVDILLVDEKVDVRLAVINRLGAFIETVGMGPSEKVRRLPRRARGAPAARRLLPPARLPAPERLPLTPSPSPPSSQERIEKISTDLAVDKNWRIRHSAMLLLPKLAAELGQTEFDKLVATTDGPHPVGFLRCPCAAPAPPRPSDGRVHPRPPRAPRPPPDAPRPPPLGTMGSLSSATTGRTYAPRSASGSAPSGSRRK